MHHDPSSALHMSYSLKHKWTIDYKVSSRYDNATFSANNDILFFSIMYLLRVIYEICLEGST